MLKSFKELLEEAEKEVKGTFSKLELDETSREKLYKWLTDKEIQNLVETSDYHVTVVYSRKYVPELEKMDPKLPIYVKPIGWDIFGKDKLLVLKLDPIEIEKIHDEAISLGATDDFPDFIPHISVAINFTSDIPSEIPKLKFKLNSYVTEDLDFDFDYSSGETDE